MPEPLTLTEGQDFTLTRLASPEVGDTMARHYLSSTTMNVKEIAYAMGFPDQSTFGRYFKSACGMSPADFRSSARAGRKA